MQAVVCSARVEQSARNLTLGPVAPVAPVAPGWPGSRRPAPAVSNAGICSLRGSDDCRSRSDCRDDTEVVGARFIATGDAVSGQRRTSAVVQPGSGARGVRGHAPSSSPWGAHRRRRRRRRRHVRAAAPRLPAGRARPAQADHGALGNTVRLVPRRRQSYRTTPVRVTCERPGSHVIGSVADGRVRATRRPRRVVLRRPARQASPRVHRSQVRRRRHLPGRRAPHPTPPQPRTDGQGVVDDRERGESDIPTTPVSTGSCGSSTSPSGSSSASDTSLAHHSLMRRRAWRRSLSQRQRGWFSRPPAAVQLGRPAHRASQQRGA